MDKKWKFLVERLISMRYTPEQIAGELAHASFMDFHNCGSGACYDLGLKFSRLEEEIKEIE